MLALNYCFGSRSEPLLFCLPNVNDTSEPPRRSEECFITSNYEAGNLCVCLCVLHISGEPSFPSLSHLADVLLRKGSAALHLVQFGQH